VSRLPVKCPKRKRELQDPEKLREHRLKDNIFSVDYMNLLMAK